MTINFQNRFFCLLDPFGRVVFGVKRRTFGFDRLGRSRYAHLDMFFKSNYTKNI